MLEGDGWKYGDAPELAEVQKHCRAATALLMSISNYPMVIEGRISKISPNGNFVFVISGQYSIGWVSRTDLRIVDVFSRAVTTSSR
jgi:hypothetical protein